MRLIRALGRAGTRSMPRTWASSARRRRRTAASASGPRATRCSRSSRRPRAAVSAAIAAQRALAAHDWPDGRRRPRPDGPPLRRGPPRRRRLRRLRGEPGGPHRGGRARRPDRAVRSDPGARRRRAARTASAIRDLGRHALRDVPRPEHLFQLDAPGLPIGVPAAAHRRPRRSATCLPRLTSFIGRDAELDELADLLAERAARHAHRAGRHRQDQPRGRDGTRGWPIGSPTGRGSCRWPRSRIRPTVRSVIARTIGLFDGPGRPAAEGLGPYLADRSVLLVLDNFERLLDAAGDVADLLEASPRSRILVTSRAPLRIVGEQEYPVPSLGEDCPTLFAERARSIRPGWEPGADGAVVDEVCALLDRLPLGVELAAARVAHLPLDGHPRPPARAAAAARARVRATCPIGSGRWRAPSPGATTCSRPSSSASCTTSRSSTAASTTSRPRRSSSLTADGRRPRSTSRRSSTRA